MKNLIIAFGVFVAILFLLSAGFLAGQRETELRWTQEREKLLIQQIEKLKTKDEEIRKLQNSILALNDSALRVRNKDALLQRKLQAELGNCNKFVPALERCSATLARCAEHAVRDRKIIEWCAIQLK